MALEYATEHARTKAIDTCISNGVSWTDASKACEQWHLAMDIEVCGLSDATKEAADTIRTEAYQRLVELFNRDHDTVGGLLTLPRPKVC